LRLRDAETLIHAPVLNRSVASLDLSVICAFHGSGIVPPETLRLEAAATGIPAAGCRCHLNLQHLSTISQLAPLQFAV
jgi:hypothetical protein